MLSWCSLFTTRKGTKCPSKSDVSQLYSESNERSKERQRQILKSVHFTEVSVERELIIGGWGARFLFSDALITLGHARLDLRRRLLSLVFYHFQGRSVNSFPEWLRAFNSTRAVVTRLIFWQTFGFPNLSFNFST